jgi:WD40 repeat protein
MSDAQAQPSGREDALNRVLADFLDALGRGDPPDLLAWQARYPAFAAELADLFAARAKIGEALRAEHPFPSSASTPISEHRTETSPDGGPGTRCPSAAAPLGTLGDYELLKELGQGGMGRVYKAWQRSLGRVVALKVIRAEAPAAEADRLRFRTEAEAAARLDHPNIVPVYEVGEQNGQPYLAQRYVEGGPLSRHLDRFRDDPRAAASLVATLARAVHHAHLRGVLHRDLKPGNVLLEWPAGAAGPPVPHVADFGLARLLDQDSGLTRTGDLVGTPSYMAPEQAGGGGAAITTATDVYGLGVILYALLTGRPPFAGPTVLETLEQVKEREPETPRRLNVRVDRDLETICLTCLAKDPRRRYATALALAEDLESWLGHRPIAARPASTRERLAKWVRRRPAAAALACVSAAAVLAVLAGSLWHGHVLGEALAGSDRLRREGLTREARLGDFLYVADMRLAKEAWDNGDLGQVAELLDRHRPGDGEAERRGFEWHWLKWCLGARAGTLKAHDGGLLCAAVSPDDRFLVTADRKGAVKVWDLASWKAVGSLAGHTDEVQRAVFSRDGRTLATCSKDRSIRLWDVATWKPAGCLSGIHQMTVTSVAFSPDGALLASCGRDRRIVLWELPRGRAVRSWAAHQDVIHDIAFAPDGHTLGSIGNDNCARLWDLASRTERARLPAAYDLLTLAFSPDGRTLAAGGYGNNVKLWDLGDLASPPVELPCWSTTWSLAFAPSGARLAAACEAGLVNVWDLGPGRREARLRKALHRRGGRGRAVVFAWGDELLLKALEEDGTVEVWNQERLAGWGTLPGLPPDLVSVALSPDGRRAASSHGNGKVCVLDLLNGRVEHSFDVPTLPERVAFSPAGEALAAACQEKGARVWEVASGREVRTLQGPGDVVRAVAFAPGGNLVATGNHNNCARLWAWPSGGLRATCGGHAAECRCLAFSADGRTLAVGSNDHTVSLWDTATGERRGLLPGHGVAVNAVAFAPDGRTLATGGHDGTIRLWDVASEELRATLSGYRKPVLGLTFSPDGRTLASQGVDDVVKLWHPGTGQELFTLSTQPHFAAGIAFTSDGRTLVTGAMPSDSKSPSVLLQWRADPAGP